MLANVNSESKSGLLILILKKHSEFFLHFFDHLCIVFDRYVPSTACQIRREEQLLRVFDDWHGAALLVRHRLENKAVRLVVLLQKLFELVLPVRLVGIHCGTQQVRLVTERRRVVAQRLIVARKTRSAKSITYGIPVR